MKTHFVRVDNGAEVLGRAERADVVGVSRLLFVLGDHVPGDQPALVDAYCAQVRLQILIPVDPHDTRGPVDVFQQLVLLVRLHNAVYRHRADPLLIPLRASYPDAVHCAAHVERPPRLWFLRLIGISLVCVRTIIIKTIESSRVSLAFPHQLVGQLEE